MLIHMSLNTAFTRVSCGWGAQRPVSVGKGRMTVTHLVPAHRLVGTSRLPSRPQDPPVLQSRVERYYRDRLERTWHGRHPMKGRSPDSAAICVRSNDYLCLAGDSRVIEAEVKALREQGHGESVSRIWLHHQEDPLYLFEKRLARLMRAEASVLCNSGYCANVGLVQSIVEPEAPVYIDMKAHLSLWEGIKSADGKALVFRHNDTNHLRRQIEKSGPGTIIVDSVYSIDGDVAPLAELAKIGEELACTLIVDETHALGAHGPDGAGLVAALGLEGKVHFRTAGLSKAVASRGGIVVCSERNAEFFRYESLPTIFSTQVLAHEVAGYNAVLDIFEGEPWRRERLHANHTLVRNGLDELGYNVDCSRSQIIAIESGDIITTVKLRDALEARGVFGALFFPPATPDKRCLIRFTINCGLTEPQLQRLLSVCAEIRSEVQLDSWASTRRKKGVAAQPPLSDAA